MANIPHGQLRNYPVLRVLSIVILGAGSLSLALEGQLLVPLSSDPFKVGGDLFGTAGCRLNFGLVGPKGYWLISLSAIVGGHIIAVFLGHSVAFRLFASGSHALRSQISMLILMIGHTIASLWTITQPMYMA